MDRVTLLKLDHRNELGAASQGKIETGFETKLSSHTKGLGIAKYAVHDALVQGEVK